MNLDEIFGIIKEEDKLEDEIIDEIFKKDEAQITDNVTADGCAFSARYGFTRLRRSDHDSWIYEQAWPDFVKRVTGCSPRAL